MTRAEPRWSENLNISYFRRKSTLSFSFVVTNTNKRNIYEIKYFWLMQNRV